MSNDNLPAGPTGPGQLGLPLAHPPQGGALAHPGVYGVDPYADPRGNDDDEIDLAEYWRVLLKHRWLILGVLASVVAAALLFTLLSTPIYRASTTLKIDQDGLQVVQVEGVNTAPAVPSKDYYQTQYELLANPALAERVASELGLAQRPQALEAESWLDKLTAALRPVAPDEQTDAEAAASELEVLQDQADMLIAGLTVEPVRNSQLVRIHFDHPDPAFAAQVINAWANEFINATVENRFEASSYAREYLEEQLATAKGRLEQSERKLVDFAQREGLVDTGEDGRSLASRNLAELNSALATTQEQRIRAEARWNQARSGSGTALPADMLANSIIGTLQERLAELEAEYQENRETFGENYPAVERLRGEMEAVRSRVGQELANIRASVKAEYDAAVQQESLLKAQLDELRDRALTVDSRSIDYNILRREVDTNRQQYDALLQRYNEIGVAGGATTNNISIVNHARVPDERHSPRIALNLAVAVLLGGMLGVLVAFVREFLDDSFKTPTDIEQKLRLSVLGIIPRLGKDETPLSAQDDARSAFAESYRSVRTALQYSTDAGVPKVLLITSPGAGEGKSTSALSLARNFAQLGKRVLLIEGDMRNPSLHRQLGLRGEAGLSSVLAGSATPVDAIQETGHDRLSVMLAGPLPPNPAELLAGSRLVSLLTVIGEQYDQVIIDGPPVLGIADAPILSNSAHATIVIIKAGSTRIGAAQTAIKRLLAARARVLGCLLTQYDARAAGYGYDYASYYAYGAPTPPRLGNG